MVKSRHKQADRSTLWIVIGSVVVMIGVVVAAAMSNRAGNESVDSNVLNSTEPHVAGPSSAVVTLTEFVDYDCSHCRDFSSVVPVLLSAFPNDLRFIPRHYPLAGETGASFQKMLAAEAAGAQGKFWEYDELLWANFGSVTREQLIGFAQRIPGLDRAKFTTDLEDKTYKDRVIKDFRDGRELGITGTPTIYLNGVVYAGSRDLPAMTAAIQALIDAATTTPISTPVSN